METCEEHGEHANWQYNPGHMPRCLIEVKGHELADGIHVMKPCWNTPVESYEEG